MTSTRQRHILHVNTNTEWGGGEYQVLHLMLGLRDQGWKVSLCGRLGHPLCVRGEEAGLNVTSGMKIAPLLRRLRPDLVHLHDSGAVDLVARAARHAGVPVVLSRRIASRLRMNWFSRRKYAPANIAAILAISETVKDVLRQSDYPIERVYVVPSGLDLEALETVKPDPALRALAGDGLLAGGLGKLSEKKNWRFMINVANAAQRSGMKITWVLAGEGRERARLEVAIEKLGLHGRVHLLGFRSDGARVLKSLDLLFFPSQMEGASVTVREAMALGKPVIAVDAPGSVESLDGHGWVVKDGSLAQAVSHLQEIASGSVPVSEKIATARQSALGRFSMEGTVDGTIRVYEAVLAGKHL